MTGPAARQGAGAAMTIRLIHGSFIMGIVLFAAVVQFLLKPAGNLPALPSNVLNALLGASVGVSILGLLLLRRRIPKRSTADSADLFWSTATAPLIIAMAPLEAGALLAIVAYMCGAPIIALGAAGIAILGMLSLYPGFFDRS
jgi:hypothetical protein